MNEESALKGAPQSSAKTTTASVVGSTDRRVTREVRYSTEPRRGVAS